MIGAKPPHILTEEERKKIVEKKDMYIDIGATSQEEAEASGIRIGDPIVPESYFEVLASGKAYLGKALDDRICCAAIVSTMQKLESPKIEMYCYMLLLIWESAGKSASITSLNLL